MTFEKIKQNAEVCALIRKGNENLGVLGYTDHSQAHCTVVAEQAARILSKLGYSKKDIEAIEDKIDSTYWDNWEKYLHDLKEKEDWTKDYSDWQHFLFALNSISDEDIKKYDLPTDYIILE